MVRKSDARKSSGEAAKGQSVGNRGADPLPGIGLNDRPLISRSAGEQALIELWTWAGWSASKGREALLGVRQEVYQAGVGQRKQQ